MIRINLLPQKREAARRASAGGSQRWLAVVGAVLALEVVGLILYQGHKNDELKVKVAENAKIDTTIKEIQKQISNHDDIKSQLQALRDREAAIGKLQAARTGPTAVLLELGKILTPGRGPTADHDKLEQLKRDNPSAMFDPAWDAHQLWILSYAEVDRKVKITGQARDGGDVSEFLKRLSLSDYFYDLQLLPATKSIDSTTHMELVKFELSAHVRY
ncbi:MAG: PilN domain-containing protein [Polyangiaceae bacterium]